MKKVTRLWLILVCLCMLPGCSSILERDYSKVGPHASQSWEEVIEETLTASSQEECESAFLSMIAQYAEEEVITIIDSPDTMTADQWVSNAINNVKYQTGLGAYAVDYAVYQMENDGSEVVAHIRIAYRRTEEEVKSVYYTTSVAALRDLLTETVAEERRSLAIYVSSFEEGDKEIVEEMIQDVLFPREFPAGVDVTSLWQTNYYPNEENPVIVEVLLLT